MTGRSPAADDDAERRALTGFLAAQRGAVLAVLDGLDEAALATAVLPSGWTPAGLVEHLGFAERHWFQEVLLGAADPLPWPDDGTPLRTSHPAAVAFAFYADQCARADGIVAGLPLDTVPAGRHPGPLGEETTDLRRILLHMIEETARHAGHLDVVRELLDGRTGLGPR
ncbi:MAG: DinB family protein [Acidimicrobiales bacterium]